MTTPGTPPPSPQWGPRPPEPPPPPPQPQPLRNGLGVASLVLGIIGVLCGLIPLLFWAAGILAVLALVFGCVGIGRARKGQADNKAVAIWGTSLGVVAAILAVVGLAITITVVDDTVDELHSTGGKKESAAGRGTHSEDALRFGDTFTYDDGVKVTVAKPSPYRPGPYAIGHADGNEALTVRITVVNGSGSTIGLDLSTVTFKDADGAQGEMIFSGDMPRELAGKLQPGERSTATYAVSLPRDAASVLEVQVEPGVLAYDSESWSGPVR
ncbi:DUF4190 domain-containing protein [Streptomyces venezuelae]|uniref:DUF4190 domain-containing protein n=1 Tax=Streptomyces venezuelae TaxID=54571 RepID=UPI0037B7DD2E